MFQGLLKTAQTKPIHKNTSPLDTLMHPTKNNQKLQSDGWPISNNVSESHHQADQQQEIPCFLEKVSKMSRKIEIAQRDIPSDIQLESHQKSSQILQVNQTMNDEQSLVYNPNKNKASAVKKLNYLRMRNAVSQMRQAHFDLAEYLEDERRLMEDFHDKMCMDIQDFFNQYRQKFTTNANQGEIQILKRQNSMLRQRMERKEAELQKVNKDLQQTKTILQQKQQQSRIFREEINIGKCTICRTLQLKMGELSQQLRKRQEQIENLLIENQRLQEYIFDIQQKMAGIDLEVQTKIKERMLQIPQIPNNNNSQQVQKLKEEIRFLQSKCKKIQQNLRTTQQKTRELQQSSRKIIEIDMKQQILNKRQIQLSNYQMNILDSQRQLEELKQANYEREREILQAQDNLNKKINQLRNKQNELSQWEAELTWKVNQTKNRPASRPNIQIEQKNYKATQQPNIINQQQYRNKQPSHHQPSNFNYKQNYQNQLKNSRQMSMKSFGKSPQQGFSHADLQQKLSPRMKTYQQEYDHKNYQQPRGEYYQSKHETGKRRQEVRPYIENEYLNKNREQHHNITRKPVLTGSNYRDNRQSSPYQNVTQYRGRPIHHVGISSNAGHYRDLSKSSRHSAAKSIKNAYIPVASGSSYAPKNQGQLIGLGNKLQRLREQIKRQIESIK